MSPFRDIGLGEMGQDFQSTVYFFSGCWFYKSTLFPSSSVKIVEGFTHFSHFKDLIYETS